MASKIIKLVNEGADYIEVGDLRSAVFVFNEALLETKKIAEEIRNKTIVTPRRNKIRRLCSSLYSDQQGQPGQHQQSTPVATPTRTTPKIQQQPFTKQQYFSVYSQPIRVCDAVGDVFSLSSILASSEANDEEGAVDSGVSCTFFHAMTVIVLFNLALTQHLNALAMKKLSQQRRAHLARAVQLYDLCLERKSKYQISLDGTATLGLINNVGLLHHELGNTRLSSRFFEFLLSHCIAEQACLQQENVGAAVSDVFGPHQQSYNRMFRTNAALHLIQNRHPHLAVAA